MAKAKKLQPKHVWAQNDYNHFKPRGYLQCDPAETFLAYKKCRDKLDRPVVLTLEVEGKNVIFGEMNKRLNSSELCPAALTTLLRGKFLKCRTSRAKVVAMQRFDWRQKNGGQWVEDKSGRRTLKTAHSMHDPSFSYQVGKVAYAHLNSNKYEECESGIHFFFSFEEAVSYI
jgi:hypothetical protein